VRIAWSEAFADERARFALRHVCEDCALFDHDVKACAHEYPIEVHARAHYEDGGPPREVVFCKEFELGG
jgi:hypothetical protein